MLHLLGVVCVFISLAIVSCGSERDLDQPGSALSSVNRLELNTDLSREPLEARLVAAPQVLVDELHRIGVDPTCSSHWPSGEEREIFRAYIRLMPAVLLREMKTRLAAVYMLEDSPYGGRFECLYSGNKSHFYVLFLNSKLFHTALSEWIDMRDNAPFVKDGSGVTVRSEVTGSYLALLHTLVHEDSHAYDFYRGVTPYFIKPLRSTSGGARAKLFTRGSWRDLSTPELVYDFAYRSSLSRYGKDGSVELKHATEAYLGLQKTPFASMYGSYSWADDFAESLTWRYLAEQYKIEYVVRVYSAKGLEAEFHPFTSKASKARLAYIDRVLKF